MSDRERELIELIESEDFSGRWEPVVGPVTMRLRSQIVDDGILPSVESADQVIVEAHGILSQCEPPRDGSSGTAGLVCGFIQSGKTASMTAVAALAKDNGYRIIVLIAGVTTNLVNQNRERLESQLRNAASRWAWIMISNPRAPRDLPQIEALVEEWRSDQYREDDRRTLLITVMKNHSHLRNLAELLSQVDLDQIPALIFDDEADQASLNTRPLAPNASSTYLTISSLRVAIPNHTFLQYTATPQAPLLITRIDTLSADFAELLSPGEGYVGGESFFAPNSPYIVTIPPNEIFNDRQLPDEPPPSLISALQHFLIGVAAGRLNRIPGNRSMLVHPSKATAAHRRYYDWVTAILRTWHTLLLSSEEPDHEHLLSEFSTAHQDISNTVGDLSSFSDICQMLPAAVNQTAVELINSIDGREVDWDNGYSHILVGGEKLGRGYTVRGLTVTYMPRGPGGWTADTIQQRARFFGYHSIDLGYCRVYLHPEVQGAYGTYIRHEQDIRDRLREQRGHSLREWRRMFYLDRRLAPTRRNVLSSPYFRPRLTEGWFVPHSPQLSPGDGQQNMELVNILTHLHFVPNDNFPQHVQALVPLREIFERLLVPLSYFDEDDAIGLCVANCNLQTLIERDNEATCLVLLMDGGRERLRRLTNGRIPQLFQGRSSAGSVSYPGDRAFISSNSPTVQIHVLRVEEGATVYRNVPAIAIRLAEQEDVLIHDE